MKECSTERMERLSVLEGKFNEVLERLDVPVLESGKVGMYLRESSINRWKGLDVLGGKFDEKMERLGGMFLKES